MAKEIRLDPDQLRSRIAGLPADRPVLIGGPTASGKSALAMRIAAERGGVVVNADALQVWSCWRVLTARPSPEDEARMPHRLYGHVAPGTDYSVGHWLAEVETLLVSGQRPVVVGGTGLYFAALTQGLAAIPPVPAAIRAEADAIRLTEGGLDRMIAALDPQTAAGIDLRNPARIQRAWEVQRTTGRGLSRWQADTPPPLIRPDAALALRLTAPRDWLASRIAHRFDIMLREGALDEARAMRPAWQPQAQWARAIGAAELIRYLDGELSLDEARSRSVAATRRYAKQQGTFFRGRLSGWPEIGAELLPHL